MAVSKFEPIPVTPIREILTPGDRKPGAVAPTPSLMAARRAKPFGLRTTVAQFVIDTQGHSVSRSDIRIGIHEVHILDVDHKGDHDNVRRVTFERTVTPAQGDTFTLTLYAAEEVSVRITVWVPNPNWHQGDPVEEKFLVGFSGGRLT